MPVRDPDKDRPVTDNKEKPVSLLRCPRCRGVHFVAMSAHKIRGIQDAKGQTQLVPITDTHDVVIMCGGCSYLIRRVNPERAAIIIPARVARPVAIAGGRS